MKTAVTVWNPRVGLSPGGFVALMFTAVRCGTGGPVEEAAVAVPIEAAAPTIEALAVDDVLKLHGRRVYLTDDDGKPGVAPILY